MIFMIFGMKEKSDNFDLYNVLLVILTDIPVSIPAT